MNQVFFRRITSALSQRPYEYADQKTERGKVVNPKYSIDRDLPTSRASPLGINALLSLAACDLFSGMRIFCLPAGVLDNLVNKWPYWM